MRLAMVHNIVSHLRSNINEGIESLEDVQSFVGKMTGLARDERLLLEAALLDSESVEMFHTCLSMVSNAAAEELACAR